MRNENYLEEPFACYKLGRTKATLRKYAREGKIRYHKEDGIRWVYNAEDVQKMLNQRLRKIIQNHSLTSDSVTKIFLDTALMLMKETKKNIYIAFYPYDEKVNYQIFFEEELKNVKQDYHALNFNKFINDGNHGNQGNYQIFATDVVKVMTKLHGIPEGKTPSGKINHHKNLRYTLEKFIDLQNKRSFNADNVKQLLFLRKQLFTIFDDDSIEKQNIKIGFLIDSVEGELVTNNVFMLSQRTIDNLKDLKFNPITELSGMVDEVYQRLGLKNVTGDIEKIKEIIHKHLS